MPPGYLTEHSRLDSSPDTNENYANATCELANVAKPYIDRADVELLVQIADTGSLTKAAKALGVHHATAFRRLTDLEQHIGAVVFERLPQGYVPTKAGETLLTAAR